MRKLALVFCLVVCHHWSKAQCTTDPNDINYLSKKTRLSNYCGDINEYRKTGITILMGACSYGKNLPLIEDCLKLKPDIFKLQQFDSTRDTSVYYTRFNACHYITFPSGAESLGPNDPLKSAEDEIEILKLFVKYFPQDSVKIYSNAFESLVKYNRYCDNPVFEYLQPHVNMNYIDSAGNSYLHIAVKYYQLETAKWLCTLGLNPYQKNKRGRTPIQLLNSHYRGDQRKQILKAFLVCSKKKKCEICEE